MRVGPAELENDKLWDIDKKLNELCKSKYVLTVACVDAARRPGDSAATGPQLSDKR